MSHVSPSFEDGDDMRIGIGCASLRDSGIIVTMQSS